MAAIGMIGILFTLLDCALDIEIAWIDGKEVYSGCGGLAHNIYDLTNSRDSPNTLNQGPPKRPMRPIAGGSGQHPVPPGGCLGESDSSWLNGDIEHGSGNLPTCYPAVNAWKANQQTIDKLGIAWVEGGGQSAVLSRDGTTWHDQDYTRFNRLPRSKTWRGGEVQGNLEWRPGGRTQTGSSAIAHIELDSSCP